MVRFWSCVGAIENECVPSSSSSSLLLVMVVALLSVNVARQRRVEKDAKNVKGRCIRKE